MRDNLDPARVFPHGFWGTLLRARGKIETQGALRTVTMQSGSRKCDGGCGRTISANKRACMKCWTFALAETHGRFMAAQATQREGSD